MSSRPGAVVRAGLLLYVPVALLSLAWLCIRNGMPATMDRVVGMHVGRDAVLGLGVGLMLVGITRIASALSAHARRAEATLGEAIGPLSTTHCLVLALASGFAEELLFRGALQPVLGLLLTSIAFGAAHVPLRRELIIWPFIAAAVGLLLGWMTNETDALIAPILTHVTVNAINLRYLSALVRDADAGAPSEAALT